MPVILATWETEIRMVDQGQPGHKFCETPFQPIKTGPGDACLSPQLCNCLAWIYKLTKLPVTLDFLS
jgi:hypothetical protein